MESCFLPSSCIQEKQALRLSGRVPLWKCCQTIIETVRHSRTGSDHICVLWWRPVYYMVSGNNQVTVWNKYGFQDQRHDTRNKFCYRSLWANTNTNIFGLTLFWQIAIQIYLNPNFLWLQVQINVGDQKRANTNTNINMCSNIHDLKYKKY